MTSGAGTDSSTVILIETTSPGIARVLSKALVEAMATSVIFGAVLSIVTIEPSKVLDISEKEFPARSFISRLK